MTTCHMAKRFRRVAAQLPCYSQTADTFIKFIGKERDAFIGKERDAETANDYFGFRYMSGAQGRWLSPDRINVTTINYASRAH